MKNNNTKKEKIIKKTLLINTHKGYHVIHCDEIEYCKAASAYCEIYLVNKKMIVYCKPLKWVDIKLQGTDNFYRIHKSFLINKNFIDHLSFKPKPEVILNDDTHVKLSFRNINWLKEKLKEDN